MSKRDEFSQKFLDKSLPLIYKSLDRAGIEYSDEQLALCADDSFKAGWDQALQHAPEVLALVEALKKISETKGLKYTSIRSFPREELIGTIEYDTFIAIEALAAFDARGKM